MITKISQLEDRSKKIGLNFPKLIKNINSVSRNTMNPEKKNSSRHRTAKLLKAKDKREKILKHPDKKAKLFSKEQILVETTFARR